MRFHSVTFAFRRSDLLLFVEFHTLRSLLQEDAALKKKYAKQISTNDDFNKMFKEVQTEGSKQFTGYAKKLYKEEVSTSHEATS